MKQVQILDGGDWYDASAELLAVPETLNLEEVYEEYRIWYREVYLVELRKAQQNKTLYERGNGDITVEYLTFSEWLRKEKGAQESSVEILDISNKF